MKSIVLAFVTSAAVLFAVASRAAPSQPEQPIAGPTAEDCGQKGDSCKGGVRCCEGLTCLSSSGGDPICVER